METKITINKFIREVQTLSKPFKKQKLKYQSVKIANRIKFMIEVMHT